MSAHPGQSARRYPPRRHGKHTVYLRPVEAQKLHDWLDQYMNTDEAVGGDPDAHRIRDKLYAIEWASDAEPREGVDG